MTVNVIQKCSAVLQKRSRKETASLILIHLLSDNVTHGHGNHQVSRVTRVHITSRGGKHKTGTIEL